MDHLDNLIGLLNHPESLHLRTSSARVIHRIMDLWAWGLDLTVSHVPGELSNGFADLLSRAMASRSHRPCA